MVTAEQLLKEVRELKQRVMDLAVSLVISPKQVRITEGLSELSDSIGTLTNGEIRFGKGDPEFGFSGIRISYPGVEYGGAICNMVSVEADTIQFGFRSSDGAAVFGGGAGVLDKYGIKVVDEDEKPIFVALTKAATINDEDLGAGDVLFGDNSADQPNILWSKSTTKAKVRSGTVTGGEISGGTFQSYGARVWYYESTGQAIADATETTLTFANEAYDDAGFYESTAPTRLTIPAGLGGVYRIGFAVGWKSNATGSRLAMLAISDTSYYNPMDSRDAVSDAETRITAIHERALVAGEYLELRVQHSAGASLDIESCSMWIRKER